MTDERDSYTDVPADKWHWACVPLSVFACASNTAGAVSELFGNLAFALGMHLKYQREIEDRESAFGPIMRED